MIREKLARFLYGRYGFDKLNYWLIGLYFVLTVINLFFGTLWLYIPALLVLAWSVFRFLSKNIYARRHENDIFLRFLAKIKQLRIRIREFPHHRYRTCPYCKATLRLPRRRGKHRTVCPRCGKELDVHILL